MDTSCPVPHALYRANARLIDPETVRDAITSPDRIASGDPPRRIYMKRYTEPGTGRPMLIRAVVEETTSELVVVTLYVTSKVAKYLSE